jgi:hypothetical protein
MGTEIKEVKVKSKKFIKWGLTFITFLLLPFASSAQFDSTFKYKGMLSVAGTLAFGNMPENNITNAYFTGSLEYYADNKISIRGDDYIFVNSLTQNSPIRRNEATYFGAFYHFFPNSQFDLILGFQPGISYTQMLVGDPSGAYPGVYPDVGTICPLTSFVAGFNFFAVKWFHFEANVRYTIGEHLTTADESNISELSFNFGLGLNLNVLKKK